MASQVEQVYYVPDTLDPNWQVVITTKPRDLYDFSVEDDNEPCQENEDIRSIQHDSARDGDDCEVSLSMEELQRIEVEHERVLVNPNNEEVSDGEEDEINNLEISVCDEDEMHPNDETDDDL